MAPVSEITIFFGPGSAPFIPDYVRFLCDRAEFCDEEHVLLIVDRVVMPWDEERRRRKGKVVGDRQEGEIRVIVRQQKERLRDE